MHILFFVDNFYPETNAPATRTLEHAKTWVKSGHQVTVITCFPNFPTGKIFTGYRNHFRKTEMIDGIKVIRIWTYITANKGFFKRILDYLSYGVHAAIQGLFVNKPDIIIGSSPQPFAAFAARFVAIIKCKPFVFEVRDLWPESIGAVTDLSKSKLMALFSTIIKRLYCKAHLIVCVTDSSKQILSQEGVNPNKIIVIKNGIDFDSIPQLIPKASIVKQFNLPKDKILIGYVGTIGMAHSIHTIVEAAQIADKRFHFVIMGEGAEKQHIANLIHTHELHNVSLLVGQDRQTALSLLNALDIAIIHLRKTPLFQTVIPSKLSEAMALGKPILLGVDGEARKILQEAQAGLYFEPENSTALYEALILFYDKPSSGYSASIAQRYLHHQFNRTELAKVYLNHLKKLTHEL